MRLDPQIVRFIKNTNISYSQLIAEVQKRWRRRLSKGLISYYRGARSGRTKPFPKEFLEPAEWDWLVGLWLTDGSRFMDRYNYVVTFTLSADDQAILNKLISILKKLDVKFRVRLKQGEKAFDIIIYRKLFYEALPDPDSHYCPKFPIAFLAGLFDGDGCIKKYVSGEKWVFSQAKYPKLSEEVYNLIKLYGPVTIKREARQNGWKDIVRVTALAESRKRLLKAGFSKFCIKARSVYNSGPAARI